MAASNFGKQFHEFIEFIGRIGTCGKCIRQAFRAALLAGCLCVPALIFGWFFHSVVPVLVAISIAASLMALWLLHIIVFGVRAARRSIRLSGPIGSAVAKEVKSQQSKRAFLSVFAKSVTAVTFATVIPSKMAYAYGNCYDPGSYPCNTTFCVPQGADNACCPQASRFLNHCDCRCYESSNFDCGSYTYCTG